MANVYLKASLRDKILKRWIPDENVSGIGFTKMVLMERYLDDEDISQEREYGTIKALSVRRFSSISEPSIAVALVQSPELIFEVEAGIDIVGFKMIFDPDGSAGATLPEVDGVIYLSDNVYSFGNAGTFSVSGTEITLS
jgi:hypothetical protein